MQPTIAFHGIASIELSAIRTGQTDSGPYAVRDLTLTDKDGKRFEVRLFNDAGDANALCVRDLDFAEEPKCALPAPTECVSCAGAGRDFHGRCTECGGTGKSNPEPVPCGHSACRQNHIETGETACVEGDVARAPKWTPPPPPKPHQWVDGVAHCTACGVLRAGSMAKLNCGTPVNNLTAKDRAEAAQASVRA